MEAVHLRRFYNNFRAVGSSVRVPRPLEGGWEGRGGCRGWCVLCHGFKVGTSGQQRIRSDALLIKCSDSNWSPATLHRAGCQDAQPARALPHSAGLCSEAVLVESFEAGRSVADFIRAPHPQNTQVGGWAEGQSMRSLWARPAVGARLSCCGHQ